MVFVFFSTPKVVGHNRVPSKHSYYWVTQPLMGYHLEKLSGCCFFNKGLIRHLIIWKTLHLDLTQIWLSKVNAPALLKERWRRFFIFFNPKKVVGHNRVPSKHSYYWVTQPLMGYLHVGFLLTKVTQQARARGGGAEATPEKDATGSPESSPPSSGKVQYGLNKFFGSAGQKKEAQPVPLHLQPQPFKRQRLSRFQQDALQERCTQKACWVRSWGSHNWKWACWGSTKKEEADEKRASEISNSQP